METNATALRSIRRTLRRIARRIVYRLRNAQMRRAGVPTMMEVYAAQGRA